jgi:hypothetical protein
MAWIIIVIAPLLHPDKLVLLEKKPMKYSKVVLEIPAHGKILAKKVEISDRERIVELVSWFESTKPVNVNGIDAWKPVYWFQFEQRDGTKLRIGFDDHFWMVEGKKETFPHKEGFWKFFNKLYSNVTEK